MAYSIGGLAPDGALHVAGKNEGPSAEETWPCNINFSSFVGLQDGDRGELVEVNANAVVPRLTAIVSHDTSLRRLPNRSTR
jgi:hypothetical protein